jgi:hypothetical protein
VARYYFHLADRHETIPDEDGLEVSDLAKAHAEALKVIEEFRTENPTMATEWEGWRLDVADGSGAVDWEASGCRFARCCSLSL